MKIIGTSILALSCLILFLGFGLHTSEIYNGAPSFDKVSTELFLIIFGTGGLIMGSIFIAAAYIAKQLKPRVYRAISNFDEPELIRNENEFV